MKITKRNEAMYKRQIKRNSKEDQIRMEKEVGIVKKKKGKK